ncbi:Methyltransferase-like protein 6 [Dichanthelium oligosanthes]|uniref:Methyltransferase-like protein 6 n=1 Tax=Dichanthelium oligosanthes TaxID=888268 RepID=A0A1E5VQK4_9POAL|nr:Methyltransferase-like protein 6 [Dichanthelium oligosanthes]
MAASEQQPQLGTTRVSSSSSTGSGRLVTPFWKEKYERDARRYWDIFYKRHEDKFFKDRHYLDKEWGKYFEGQVGENMVVLEVGCGAGNTIFPLLSTYPDIFAHACDFSPRAVSLVKKHKDFRPDRINAFVCDITSEQLTENMEPSSADIVTMIFVLSAVAPDKMPLVLQNLRSVLKPGGRVLFRDYAFGDLAQERLMSKGQQISENFYVRGDGTRAYYFSNEYLVDLFSKCGFTLEEICVHNKQVENRSLDLVMNRIERSTRNYMFIVYAFQYYKFEFSEHCVHSKKYSFVNSFFAQVPENFIIVYLRNWIQATFSLNSVGPNGQHDLHACKGKEDKLAADSAKKKNSSEEIDLSEDFCNMFETSHNLDEVQIIGMKAKGHDFKIKVLTKEYQHTCKLTGLMLWESAQLMCGLLAENPSIVAGKRVLELGCGSAGICSMVAASFAQFVVATDGDTESLDLLRKNISSNLEPNLLDRIMIRKLFWGDKDDVRAVRELCGNDTSFDCIIGTDVTYNPDAILPLFKTARELISEKANEDSRAAFILSYIQRRVDENSILSNALAQGFRLVDKWINGVHDGNGIISSWFSGNDVCSAYRNTTLSILYFEF